MNLLDVIKAYEDRDDGLVHWSAGALGEAERLVQQSLDHIEANLPNARAGQRANYLIHQHRLTPIRDHIQQVRQVPAQKT